VAVDIAQFRKVILDILVVDYGNDIKVNKDSIPPALEFIINAQKPKHAMSQIAATLINLGLKYEYVVNSSDLTSTYRFHENEILQFMSHSNFADAIKSSHDEYQEAKLSQLKEKSLNEKLIGVDHKLEPKNVRLNQEISEIENYLLLNLILKNINDNVDLKDESKREKIKEQIGTLDSKYVIALNLHLRRNVKNHEMVKFINEIIHEKYSKSLALLKPAIQYIYDQYLSKAYSEGSCIMDWELQTPNGKIERPNHGLAHTLRTAQLLPVVAEYLRNAAGDGSYQYSESEIVKLQLVVLFWVTGRENDVGSRHDKKLFTQFREQSVSAFETYVRSIKPSIMNENEISKYKDLLLNETPYNADPDNVLLNFVHDLDVARCLDNCNYHEHVLKQMANYLQIADVTLLSDYAKGLIYATGDRDLTQEAPRAYNPNVFFKASTDIDYCFERMTEVSLPSESNIVNDFIQGQHEFVTADIVDDEKTNTLQYGPLPKNVYSKQLEKLIKKILHHPDQISIESDPQNDQLHIYTGEFHYNLTEILKYADLSHLEFSDDDYAEYKDQINNALAPELKILFPPDVQNSDGDISVELLKQNYPESSLSQLHPGALTAINIYTGNMYAPINHLLRTGTISPAVNLPLQTLLTAAIAGAALAKVNEFETVPTYRCLIPSEYATKKVAESKQGLIEQSRGFTSTSAQMPAEHFFSASYHYIYNEVRGLYVAPVSQVIGEREVLLPPGQFQWSHVHADSKGRNIFTNEQVVTLNGLTQAQLELLPYDANFVDQFQNTALMYAVLFTPNSVPQVLQETTYINTQNLHGKTALHFALYEHIDLLNKIQEISGEDSIIRSGHEVNDNKAHLHIKHKKEDLIRKSAASEKHIAMLLDKGASLLMDDKVGVSPLDIAMSMDLPQTLRQKIDETLSQILPEVLENILTQVKENTDLKLQEAQHYFEQSLVDQTGNSKRKLYRVFAEYYAHVESLLTRYEKLSNLSEAEVEKLFEPHISDMNIFASKATQMNALDEVAKLLNLTDDSEIDQDENLVEQVNRVSLLSSNYVTKSLSFAEKGVLIYAKLMEIRDAATSNDDIHTLCDEKIAILNVAFETEISDMPQSDLQRLIEMVNDQFAVENEVFAAIKSKNDERLLEMITDKTNQKIQNVHGNSLLFMLIYHELPSAALMMIQHDDFQEPTDLSHALFQAVYYGYTDIAVKLLEKGADIKALDNETTLVFAAMEYGDEQLMNELVTWGASLNELDSDNKSLLMRAIEYGNIEAVKFLTLAKANGSYSMELHDNDPSVMKLAMNKGNIEIIEYLIDAGLNVELKDAEGRTALLLAVEGGNDPVFDKLIQKGADYNIQDHSGFTPLALAAQKGNEHMVDVLIGLNATPYVHAANYKSPLSLAIENKHLAIATKLLGTPQCVNALHEYPYWTDGPLYAAVKLGNIEMVNLLLEHGALINIFSNGTVCNHLSPAVDEDNDEMVSFLISKGADYQFKFTESLIFTALFDNKPKALKALIEGGADVNCIGGYKPDYALIKAIEWHKPEMAIVLIQHGAKVDIKDKQGTNLLEFSVKSGYKEVVLGIVKSGPDSFQSHVLHLAIKHQQIDLLNALLEQSTARINDVDEKGDTPLMNAIRKEDLVSIELLLKHGADPAIPGRNAVTALDLADGNEQIKQLLMIHSISNRQKEKAPDFVPQVDAQSSTTNTTSKARIASAFEKWKKIDVAENSKINKSTITKISSGKGPKDKP